MTIPSIDPAKPLATTVRKPITDGDILTTGTEAGLQAARTSLNPSSASATSGMAFVEIDQKEFQELSEYRTNIKGINHDVRTPLSAIFNLINAASFSSLGFESSSELVRFKELYKDLVLGEQEMHTVSTQETLEKDLGKLKYWRTITEQDGDPKSILNASKDYQRLIEKQFREELVPCIRKLAEEMKEINPKGSDAILKNADFVLDLLSNNVSKNFNPVELTQQAVDSLYGTSASKQMSFDVKQDHFNKEVLMNPAAFKNALVNLFTNAAKASQGKHRAGEAKCTVTFQEEDNFAVIKVSDNGPGIPAGIREEIFKEGVSGSFGETKSASGSSDGSGKNEGLGLSSVKRAIEKAGGSIHVEESQGGGACFVIKLPIHSLPIEEHKSSKLEALESSSAVEGVQERRPSKTGPFKILIIDDNKDTCESMKMLIDIFLKDQCSVEIATGTKQALDKIQNGFIPHLIFTDVNLHNGDCGPKIKLKLESPGINIQGVQVIAITGDSAHETKKIYPYLDNVLQKPVDPTGLCTEFIPKLIKQTFSE